MEQNEKEPINQTEENTVSNNDQITEETTTENNSENTEENTASIQVFKKLGMTYLNDTLIDHIPSVTYEIYKENFK